jgi:hypothetical protein
MINNAYFDTSNCNIWPLFDHKYGQCSTNSKCLGLRLMSEAEHRIKEWWIRDHSPVK